MISYTYVKMPLLSWWPEASKSNSLASFLFSALCAFPEAISFVLSYGYLRAFLHLRKILFLLPGSGHLCGQQIQLPELIGHKLDSLTCLLQAKKESADELSVNKVQASCCPVSLCCEWQCLQQGKTEKKCRENSADPGPEGTGATEATC